MPMLHKDEISLKLQEYITQYPMEIFGRQTLDFVTTYDNFWQRTNEIGHLTASTWVLNGDKTKALMTYHKKLDIWVQLGGHIEPEDKSIWDACARELNEESGLNTFRLISDEIFDVDIHQIPMNKDGFPAHLHLDIRAIFIADESEQINFDLNESNSVKWIELNRIEEYTQEESVLRMVRKSRRLF